MAVSIGPTIGIKGESAYTNAMKRIVAETKKLDSEMDLLTSSFKKNDSAIENNKKKYELLQKQMDGAQRQLLIMKDGLDLATKKHDEARREVERAQKAHEEITKVYGKESDEAKRSAEEWEKASNQYNVTGKDVEKFAGYVDQAQASINRLNREMEELPSTTQLVGEAMQKWGGAFEEVGSNLTRYLTTPILAAGTAFTKWASDFTDGMAKIYTIADEGKKPMAEMREELIQLSNQTGYSLEDLAEAEYQAVSASVDTSKAVSFLSDAAKLARGGFTTTTQAVDLLTTVINAYGMEAEDASYISDVLLRTQNDGKTIIDELANSMGTVIPTAANYNVSLEQLAAAYATMTKQGVNTSRATTFLNAMFTELEKESSAISKTLSQETGKSFAQLMGEGKSLADVLGILYESVDEDNEQFQRLFGNIRSGKAASALLTDDFAILNYEVERMSNATGQTAHAMEVLETPSLKAKRAIQQLKNSGIELGTTLINTLAPTFEKVVLAIKDITDAFSQMDEHQMKLILGFGAFLAAIGPMLTIFGKLNTAIGTFMAQLAAGTVPLTTTVGLITAGIAAFAGIATAAEVAAEQHRNEIAALWGLDEQMKTNIDTSKQMEMSYVENKNAILDEMNATINQAEIAQSLVDKYNDLIDANGQVRAGHEDLANVYLNQLAQTLGMELADVQALVEENGKFGESIQNTIDAMIRRAEAAAYEQILTDAIMRQTQAEMELAQQENDLVVQQARVKQAQEATKQAYEAMIDAQKRGDPEIGRYEQAWRDAVETESQATAAEGQLRDSIDLTRTRVTAAEQDAQNARRKIKETAEGTMTDTTNAIKSGGDRVVTEAGNLSSRAESALSVDGYSPGYNASSGLAKGIRDASWMVEQEAARVSNLASAAMARALRERSPSRVTADIGRYFSEGFAIGIEDSTYKAISAANMLANAAAGGVQMVGYEPPTTNYSKTVSAPISINLTIEGNVDGDDRAFAQNVADSLVNLINRKSEVFA